MKTWPLVTAVACSAALGASGSAAPAPKATPTTWSATADGVHARLVLTATTDAQQRAQVAIALEIANVSDVGGPLALPWADDPGELLTFVLEDDQGTPIELGAIGGSHVSTGPYVANLPAHSTLHQEITNAAIEYVPGGRTLFRPVTFQAWELPAKRGTLYLRATLKPRNQGKHAKLPRAAWATPLQLPRVALP